MKNELVIEDNNISSDVEEKKYQRGISLEKELTSEEIISFDDFNIKKFLKQKTFYKPPQGRTKEFHNIIINFNKKKFR